MCGTMVLERTQLMETVTDEAKKIVIIAAIAKNGVIGFNGSMPWRLSTDLKRFKSLTTGNSIIIGGNTMRGILKTIGKPLPNRQNIVITRHPCSFDWREYGITAVSTARDALKAAESEKIYICGGAQIYSMFLDMGIVDEMMITRVLSDVEGDTFFPEWNRDEWDMLLKEFIPAGEKDDFPSSFIIYKKAI